MRVVVPFDGREPKTRLAQTLDPGERADLAAAMLRDVLAAVRDAGHTPELLSTGPVDLDAPVTVDERPLSAAVNAVLGGTDGPVAVVMADLPLATGTAVSRLLDARGDVVLAPGLGGGTNAFLARQSGFRVDYHGGSYRKHAERAAAAGLTVEAVDSFRLALDVDRPRDLAEVLLHGDGRAVAWLRGAGFELVADGDRGLRVER